MPKLTEKINEDLKQAMRDKRADVLSTLRMLLAAMRNKEITLRQGGVAELTDEQALEAVASEIKKRRDAAETYGRGGRPELADKENAEIKILEKYLPAQLARDELEKIIQGVIAGGAADLPAGEAGFGKVMGQVMARVKGRAQGAKVGEMVKKLLGK